MIRNRWLASLKFGDVVSLRCGGDEINAEVIANLGNRGFVLHETGQGQSVLSMAEISTDHGCRLRDIPRARTIHGRRARRHQRASTRRATGRPATLLFQ